LRLKKIKLSVSGSFFCALHSREVDMIIWYQIAIVELAQPDKDTIPQYCCDGLTDASSTANTFTDRMLFLLLRVAPDL